MDTDDIDMEVVLCVRSTDTRMEIVRQLQLQSLRRPREFVGEVRDHAETSEGNIYQALDKLLEYDVVEKSESETSKATLYSLTELGSRVADFLDIGDGDEGHHLQSSDAAPTTEASADDLVRSAVPHHRLPESEDTDSADATKAEDSQIEQIKRQITRIVAQTDADLDDVERAVGEIRAEGDE
jgi:DNA-binding PadR family transcriptional regulator